MKIRANATLVASTGVVTFTDYSSGGIDLDKVLLVVNVTDNIILYNFADSSKSGTVSGNTLDCIDVDTTGMANGDKILAYYDDPAATQTVELGTTDNAVLDAMVVDLAAIEVLLTSANTDHAANEVLLGTIDADTDAIKTSVELLDNAVDGNYLNTNLNIAGTDVDGGSGNKSAQSQRVVIATDDIPIALVNTNLTHLSDNLDTLETTNNAMQVLLGTIDSDTDAIKTAVEGTITVDGTVTANAGTNLNTSALATHAKQDTVIGHVDGIETLLGTIDSDTNAIKTAVELLDNAIDGNYINTNMNLAGSDAQAGEGAITSSTQRVTIATDDDSTAHLATIAGAVDTQVQVDIVGALPAGSAAIGKLAANSGVDIGDVDVTSTVQPVGYSTIANGSNTTVGTSAEYLYGDSTSVPCKHVDIMASYANTGFIYVGGSGVTAATGILLAAGDTYSVDITNLNLIYVLAIVNGEDVQWVVYN